LPVYVFQNLSALFHAVAAHRVFLQGFSPRRSLRSLSEPVPFMTLVRTGDASGEPQSTQRDTSPSRSCSPSGFATFEAGVSRTREGRCPPGFLTSRGFTLATAHRLRGGSPRGLHAPIDDIRLITKSSEHCPSGYRLSKDWLVSCETAAPSGLLAPFPTAADSARRCGWLMDSPRC